MIGCAHSLPRLDEMDSLSDFPGNSYGVRLGLTLGGKLGNVLKSEGSQAQIVLESHFDLDVDSSPANFFALEGTMSSH